MSEAPYLMAYSDYPILDAIKLINRKRGGYITHQQIADVSGAPLRTVERGTQRLLRAGKIKRCAGARKLGFVYEVVECQN